MRDDWVTKKLGDFSETINGLWTGKKEPYVSVKVYTMTNFSKESDLNQETEPREIMASLSQYEKRKLNYGDILIEKSGGGPNQPVGRAIIFNIKNDENNTFSNFTTRLRINSKTNDSIFSYYIHKYLKYIYLIGETEKFQKNSTNIRNLQLKEYLQLEIPIPPIKEQKEIVKILDNVFESIEKAKANIEKNIENAKELFQSKLNQIFSQNVEGWEMKKFLDCLNKVKNTIKIPKRKFLNDGLYPIVSQESSLISGYWDNMNDLLNVEKPVIIFGDHTKAIKFIDFSFVRGADGIKVLLPIEQINSKFFYYLLRSVKLRDLGYARHYRLLKELVISYPTIEKQKKIVETLDIIDNHIQSLLVSYEEELKNLEELKKSILQKAFSGELTNKNKAA